MEEELSAGPAAAATEAAAETETAAEPALEEAEPALTAAAVRNRRLEGDTQKDYKRRLGHLLSHLKDLEDGGEEVPALVGGALDCTKLEAGVFEDFLTSRAYKTLKGGKKGTINSKSHMSKYVSALEAHAGKVKQPLPSGFKASIKTFLDGFEKLVGDAKGLGEYDDRTADALPVGLYR